MNRRIVVVTTEGGSREDGNVYYANYLLVESSTLKFDEAVFDDNGIDYGDIPELDDEDEEAVETDRVPNYLRSLGYAVDELETKFITANE